MRRNSAYSRLATRLALENEAELNAEAGSPEQVIGDNANSLETDLVEVADDAADISTDEAQVEETTEAAEALESIACSMRAAVQNGGLDRYAAEGFTTMVGYLERRVGIVSKPMPSLEGYGGANSRIGTTALALESVTDKLMKFWQTIKEAILNSIQWVKDFFLKIFGAAEKLEKRATELAKKVAAAKVEGSPANAKVENARLAKLFTMADKSNVVAAVGRVKGMVDYFYADNAIKNLGTEELVKKVSEIKDGVSAEEAGQAVPINGLSNTFFETVADYEAKGFGKKVDGVVLHRSKELPGNKATLMFAASSLVSGKAAVPVLNAVKNEFGAYDPKAAEPEVKELPTLTGDQIKNLTDSVNKMATAIKTGRNILNTSEKYKKELAGGVDKITKLIKAAGEDQTKKDILEILKADVSAARRTIDQPLGGLSVHAITVGKGALDYVEESLKQYKAEKAEK